MDDACPTLYTARLTLEPLTAAHADRLYAVLGDESLWRYTDERAPTGVVALRERYARLESRRSPDGHARWLNWVLVFGTQGAVGYAQATVASDCRSADIGYVIGRCWWGRGMAREAMHAVIVHLDERLGVQTVYATVDARNVASIRVLQKLAFGSIDRRNARTLRFGRRTHDAAESTPNVRGD